MIGSSVQQVMAQAIRHGYRIDLPRFPRRPDTVVLLTLTGDQIDQRNDVSPEKVIDTIAALLQDRPASGDLDRGRWGKGCSNQQQCRYCGCGGPDGDHQRTVCRACDMPQCLYPSKCRICLVGYIQGVSYGLYSNDRCCGYKKCTNEAVAEAPRVKRVCRDHLPRVTRKWAGRTISIADDITERIATLGQTYGVPDWQRTSWYAEGVR
ncbi:hypothetical protein AB0392_06060 [Nonomuraea angiospora]|uniref:hypothetical protein n=1 Tax=Nonomuraea angiospora TaxID=46172 RepID=UPI00344CD744